MRKKPKASVVIPVLNRRTLIARSLQSVASQSWRPLEIIVADNGSTDGTYEEALSLADTLSSEDVRISVIRHAEPGAAKTRNAGYSHATGDVVLFFDSDDIMSSGTIEAYMDRFAANKKTDIVVGTSVIHTTEGKSIRRGRRRGNELLNHFHHCTLSTQVYAARRSFLARVEDAHGELWPEHLGVWDDWAFGFRLLMFRPQVEYIDFVVACIEQQQQSITGEAYCTTCAERYLAAIADIECTALIHTGTAPVITPREQRKWKNLTLYRRVLLAALLERESRTLPGEMIARSPYADSEELRRESRRLLTDALRETDSLRVRTALRFAYRYIRLGLRGCATLVSPLLF